MADGADQESSERRATTTPDPKRAKPGNPAFDIVMIARPYAEVCISE